MLSFLGTIGRMLPGYLNGYRMAIDDNWKDLNQYNNVQRGQISNAFMGETFPLALNMESDKAEVSRMAADQYFWDYLKRMSGLGSEFDVTSIQSAMAPSLALRTLQDKLFGLQQNQLNAAREADILDILRQNGLNFGLNPNANGQSVPPGTSNLPTAAQGAPEDPYARLNQNAGVRYP